MSSKTGKVKWFNPKKGYGFIDQDDDEKDMFLHITALQKANISVLNEGDKISYVKIINKPGVRPIELAKQSEIDSSKYMEFMQSTLDQITSSMNMDFDTIIGKPRQTGLDQFFWN